MANNFKNTLTQAIGTSEANVYVALAGSQTTVVGMTVSNIISHDVTANVFVHSAGSSAAIIKNATVEYGSALVPVGALQKVVLTNGDYITVQSSDASSLDVIVSVLEIS